MTTVRDIELVSVNVGRPDYLGERRGRMVESGIRKRPVAGPAIVVGPTTDQSRG
jgi:hypothetical protein